jgi:hypothetical protein
VRPSSKHVDLAQPWWADYLPFLDQLKGTQIPACEQLNSLLPRGLKSESGQAIHFVPSTELDDGAYEHRIYTTGQVSTRPDNWHDLFNALVWMRFPRIKIAMNTLHYHAYSQQTAGRRGALRDALTLFDECGVIVFSHLSPYKSMPAKALLVQLDTTAMTLPREELLVYLDQQLAELLLAGNILTKPACLAPLPLAGVPGWWPSDEQDDGFYADPQVFRAPPANLEPAPVVSL